jgi:hypothetical protein
MRQRSGLTLALHAVTCCNGVETTNVRVPIEDGLYLIVAGKADLDEALEEADFDATGLALEAHAEVLFVSTIDPDTEWVELEIRQLAAAPDSQLDELASDWGPWDLGQIHAESPIEIQTQERVPICAVTDETGDYDVALFGRPTDQGVERHLLLVWPEPSSE